jgi:hypothetical protein
MNRAQLEHVIRAAAMIADDDELIVIGSQSILGQYPAAPPDLCVSNEVDLYPKNHPERWNAIDGAIGELSPFHETFGYYAQGVEDGTATLPDGWAGRLVAVKNAATRGATGFCLEPHDLVISKYVAGREKDRRFIRAAIAHGMLDEARLRERLALTPLDASSVRRIGAAIAGHFSGR